jgi:hypothetical protein
MLAPTLMALAVGMGLHGAPAAGAALAPCLARTSAVAPGLARTSAVHMQLWSDGTKGRRSRFEDGEDKRISQKKGASRRLGVSRTEGFGGTESARIRQAKVGRHAPGLLSTSLFTAPALPVSCPPVAGSVCV